MTTKLKWDDVIRSGYLIGGDMSFHLKTTKVTYRGPIAKIEIYNSTLFITRSWTAKTSAGHPWKRCSIDVSSFDLRSCTPEGIGQRKVLFKVDTILICTLSPRGIDDLDPGKVVDLKKREASLVS